MTILADFLRDSQGSVHRIYPIGGGELRITTSQLDDGWSDPSYTIPSGGELTYQTLVDSAGTTWYLWPTSIEEGEGELWLTTVLPDPIEGTWNEPIYGDKLTPTEATTGNEIYLAMRQLDATDWYVYPDGEGGYTITTTEPS